LRDMANLADETLAELVDGSNPLRAMADLFDEILSALIDPADTSRDLADLVDEILVELVDGPSPSCVAMLLDRANPFGVFAAPFDGILADLVDDVNKPSSFANGSRGLSQLVCEILSSLAEPSDAILLELLRPGDEMLVGCSNQLRSFAFADLVASSTESSGSYMFVAGATAAFLYVLLLGESTKPCLSASTRRARASMRWPSSPSSVGGQAKHIPEHGSSILMLRTALVSASPVLLSCKGPSKPSGENFDEARLASPSIS